MLLSFSDSFDIVSEEVGGIERIESIINGKR